MKQLTLKKIFIIFTFNIYFPNYFVNILSEFMHEHYFYFHLSSQVIALFL